MANPHVPQPVPAEKACPKCAETVKGAAEVCRFCGYSFRHRTLHPAMWELGSALFLASIALGIASALFPAIQGLALFVFVLGLTVAFASR